MGLYKMVTADIVVGEAVKWKYERIKKIIYDKDTAEPMEEYFEIRIPTFENDSTIIPGYRFRLPEGKTIYDYKYVYDEEWRLVDENNNPKAGLSSYGSTDLMFHERRSRGTIYGCKLWMPDGVIDQTKLLQMFTKYETLTGRKGSLFRIDYEKEGDRYFATMD